jgi:hypothetical protein
MLRFAPKHRQTELSYSIGSQTHSPLRFAIAYPLRQVGISCDSLLISETGSSAVGSVDSPHAANMSATPAMMSFRKVIPHRLFVLLV